LFGCKIISATLSNGYELVLGLKVKPIPNCDPNVEKKEPDDDKKYFK